MTPRHLIEAIDLDQPFDVSIERTAQTPHNFYPVYEGSIDNVVGIMASRELGRRHVAGEPVDIRAAMEPPLFVPEISPVLTVVDQMRHMRSPMAIVVDEYGGVEGLLTFADDFSDMVDEVDDQDQAGKQGAVQREDGSWPIDGVFPAHEITDLLDLEALPGEAEGRFETVGGFMVDQLGTIPQAGDHVTFGGYRFELMDTNGNRVDKVLVQRLAGWY